MANKKKQELKKVFISIDLIEFMSENGISSIEKLLKINNEKLFKMNGCNAFIILEITSLRNVV